MVKDSATTTSSGHPTTTSATIIKVDNNFSNEKSLMASSKSEPKKLQLKLQLPVDSGVNVDSNTNNLRIAKAKQDNNEENPFPSSNEYPEVSETIHLLRSIQDRVTRKMNNNGEKAVDKLGVVLSTSTMTADTVDATIDHKERIRNEIAILEAEAEAAQKAAEEAILHATEALKEASSNAHSNVNVSVNVNVNVNDIHREEPTPTNSKDDPTKSETSATINAIAQMIAVAENEVSSEDVALVDDDRVDDTKQNESVETEEREEVVVEERNKLVTTGVAFTETEEKETLSPVEETANDATVTTTATATATAANDVEPQACGLERMLCDVEQYEAEEKTVEEGTNEVEKPQKNCDTNDHMNGPPADGTETIAEYNTSMCSSNQILGFFDHICLLKAKTSDIVDEEQPLTSPESVVVVQSSPAAPSSPEQERCEGNSGGSSDNDDEDEDEDDIDIDIDNSTRPTDERETEVVVVVTEDNITDPPTIIRQTSIPQTSKEPKSDDASAEAATTDADVANDVLEDPYLDVMEGALKTLTGKIEECTMMLTDQTLSREEQMEAAKLMQEYAKAATAFKKAV